MSGGNKAPKAYTPAHQAGADSAFYNTLGSLTQQDQGTAAIANAGYDAAYSGIVNNPYDPSMLAGINTAANTASGVAASDLSAANAMGAQATAGYGDAATARGLAAPMASDAAALRAYAPFLAEFGFDPNMSEYNFGLGQTRDEQNVINAEQGVAGSPFAAGATGDAMSAYTRNYNDARASKAMQALAALSGLSTAAGGLDTSAIGALTSAGGIASNAAGLATNASGLAHTGAETQALAAQMPYEASNQIETDRMAALDQLVNGRSTASQNLRGDAEGYANYMNVGQNATALNQKAAQINAQNSLMGQLGQLAGIAVQVGAHFIPGYG